MRVRKKPVNFHWGPMKSRALQAKMPEVLFECLGRIASAEHTRCAKYNPPAMRVRNECYTKKSPSRYNVVVQATL